jgi:protein-S-isoprenylcysteine O-methyltransferase Ste14
VTAFISGGPYRISRNPIYVAFTLIYVGVALLCRAVWPFLFLPVVLVGIVRQVQREEAYMERRFGHPYVSYKAKVRRWL